jgi:hypothetical protein
LYGALTPFDKTLYPSLASDSAFTAICEVEKNLTLAIQKELRGCRDPSIIIVVNGAWGPRSVAAARKFLDEAKYWEWTKDDLETVFPSVAMRDLIRQVRAEGYGPICTNRGADLPQPVIDVSAACAKLLADR